MGHLRLASAVCLRAPQARVRLSAGDGRDWIPAQRHLRGPEFPHEELRSRARRRLGIPEGVHAVLYAPTWRDYNSVSEFRSERVDLVRYDEVALQLGPGYVLLVRGHQMAARTGSRVSGSAGIVDVTDYPEIRDLVLASDSAVLDYSSLRFDYALTRKPMAFLVPDLERYRESRDWLLDYGPTAPGPLVKDESGLVEAIRRFAEDRDVYASAAEEMVTSLMPLEDGEASSRLANLLPL